MPDQAPPAPAGCVYGPWWDQWYWLCVAPWKSVTGMVLASHLWDGKQWQRCTEACESELLRLAKENAELRASQPSEEDRAVLWLMKREDYDVCFERDHFAVYRRVEDTDNDWCWVSDSPADEAKKLGWGG